MQAQRAQCGDMGGIPCYCVSGNKGFYEYNVGGHAEDPSEGEYWEDSFQNVAGYGIDSFWTLNNMHTVETPSTCPPLDDNNNMVIDWGFKVNELKLINPIYASWLYDWNVLGLLYESLLIRNSSDLGQFLPYIASNYEPDTYEHPVNGTCTKIRFTLRDDVLWQDGVPLTVADVHFTFVELKQILEDRGLPNPWWWSSVQNILSFSIIDPYNFEVLLDVKSYWAVGWIGGNIILPKHIWKPIAEEGDVQSANLNNELSLISSGPWVFDEYDDEIPATTLHRADNYHRQSPVAIDVVMTEPAEYEWRHKYDETEEDNYTLVMMADNLDTKYGLAGTVDVIMTPYGGAPVTLASGAPVVLPPGHAGGPKPIEEWVHLACLRGKFGCFRDWGYYAYDKESGDLIIWKEFHIHSQGVGIYLYSYEPLYYIPYCEWFTLEIYLHVNIDRWNCLPEYNIFEYSWWQKTIPQDIAGSTLYDDLGFPEYEFKKQVPTCDYKVDMKDIGRAARAFGSYPGHERWDAVSDINVDYKVDMKDIGGIARQFGWTGTPYIPPP
jgi:hypothetical protein